MTIKGTNGFTYSDELSFKSELPEGWIHQLTNEPIDPPMIELAIMVDETHGEVFLIPVDENHLVALLYPN